VTSTRTFHLTTITFRVLSEDPIPGEMELADVIREADQGGFVGDEDRTSTVIDGPTAARELIQMRSEPGFFQLDEDGEDLEDEADDDEGRAAQDFALSLHNEDQVTVRATGQVVTVLGSPYLEGEVVMVPTVNDTGGAHTYPHTELS
jgi:hypothetical protein